MRRPWGARQILATAVVALAPLMVSGVAAAGTPAPSGPKPPAQSPAAGPNEAEQTQTATPIKHFITLMQENHSFDNYFGTYPGADGIPDGVCMPYNPNDESEGCVKPFHLENRAITDLGHSASIFEAEYAGGDMDGFVSAFSRQGQANADQSMAYYDDRDIPYYWNIADEYVLFDRFFTSGMGGSVQNHVYWVSGQPGVSDPTRDVVPKEGWDLPTVFDQLQASGVSWKFYVQNYDPSITLRNPGNGDKSAQVVWVPLLNFPRYLDDPEFMSHIVDMDQYFVDLDNGTLPAVSYLVPSGSSEHPPGSIQAGEAFVRSLVNSLMRSSAWSTSAFHWTYDDWGGWYDHVAPPKVDDYGYGFRAPALLVSPYAKRGYIDSTELDFTSILKFIQENWNLEPLASRDAAANNFLDAFDFNAEPRAPKVLDTTRNPVLPKRADLAFVYLTYGGALAIAVGAIVVARRRHRTVEAPA